ncbi:MAG: nucleotide exchange factor GrpE [Anaerohalosphaera sp.]|nr:nucleotide exchange factor GrpE [Anaerohalosphaera sp.]
MTEESSTHEQSEIAALELFRCIRYLVDTSIKNCLQKTPEQAEKESVGLHEIKAIQQQALHSLESVNKQLGTMASMNSLLENIGNVNQRLSQQHYEEHIIQPIVRSLLPVIDLVEDASKNWNRTSKVKKLLRAVGSQLDGFLTVYDLHPIRHKTNSKFNPKEMQPIERIPTEDQKLHGHFAESLRVGVRYGSERVLRLEAVAIFKYQPTKSINENVNILVKEQENVNTWN